MLDEELFPKIFACQLLEVIDILDEELVAAAVRAGRDKDILE